MAFFFIADLDTDQLEMTDWFYALATTYGLWLFGTHPAGVIFNKFVLPTAVRRSARLSCCQRRGGKRRGSSNDDPYSAPSTAVVHVLPSIRSIHSELAARLIRGDLHGDQMRGRRGMFLKHVADELQLVALDDVINEDRQAALEGRWRKSSRLNGSFLGVDDEDLVPFSADAANALSAIGVPPSRPAMEVEDDDDEGGDTTDDDIDYAIEL